MVFAFWDFFTVWVWGWGLSSSYIQRMYPKPGTPGLSVKDSSLGHPILSEPLAIHVVFVKSSFHDHILFGPGSFLK